MTENYHKVVNPSPRQGVSAVAGIAFWLLAVAATAQTQQQPLSVASQPPGIRVSMHSELQPLTINQMHSWIIEVQTATGQAVEDANIKVSGGMPAHNHGLATSPQVTAYLGDGRYRLQGVRFHMNGEWELRLEIDHRGTQYQATLPMSL